MPHPPRDRGPDAAPHTQPPPPAPRDAAPASSRAPHRPARTPRSGRGPPRRGKRPAGASPGNDRHERPKLPAPRGAAIPQHPPRSRTPRGRAHRQGEGPFVSCRTSASRATRTCLTELERIFHRHARAPPHPPRRGARTGARSLSNTSRDLLPLGHSLGLSRGRFFFWVCSSPPFASFVGVFHALDQATLNHAARGPRRHLGGPARRFTALRLYFETHRYLQPPAEARHQPRRLCLFPLAVLARSISPPLKNASPMPSRSTALHRRPRSPSRPSARCRSRCRAGSRARWTTLVPWITCANCSVTPRSGSAHDPAPADALAKSLFACERTDRAPDALRFTGTQDLFRTEQFTTGQFEIQDLASQLVGLECAPKPGETWWDACAGEGGKTLHLADLMANTGLIWATDHPRSVSKRSSAAPVAPSCSTTAPRSGMADRRNVLPPRPSSTASSWTPLQQRRHLAAQHARPLGRLHSMTSASSPSRSRAPARGRRRLAQARRPPDLFRLHAHPQRNHRRRGRFHRGASRIGTRSDPGRRQASGSQSAQKKHLYAGPSDFRRLSTDLWPFPLATGYQRQRHVHRRVEK